MDFCLGIKYAAATWVGERTHGEKQLFEGLVSEGYIEAIRPACAFTDNSCLLLKAVIVGAFFSRVQSPR